MPTAPALAKNFLAKVTKPDGDAGCWMWTDYLSDDGYGSFRGVGAHRESYRLFVGKIAKGLHIDHLCRVRSCVNPNHLEAVTQQENIRRGNVGEHNRKKTHCIRGHPYSGKNLFFAYKIRDGKRVRERRCRKCENFRRRKNKRGLDDINAEVDLTNKKKTHCPKGHKYNKKNTAIRKHGKRAGWRECRICISDRGRVYRAKGN